MNHRKSILEATFNPTNAFYPKCIANRLCSIINFCIMEKGKEREGGGGYTKLQGLEIISISHCRLQ